MKPILFFFTSVMLSLAANAQTTIFLQNFDSVAKMFTSGGWSQNNLSNPIGTPLGDYYQGGPVGGIAPSLNGPADSFIRTAFQCGAGVSTLSNWLLSPIITFQNGDVVSFFTLSYNNSQYPDRLECRLSVSGSSVNVGTTEFSVGDFTTNLVTVNPNLDKVSYPALYLMNQTWTKFSGVVSGLTGPITGRIGFRYFVTNGGPSGANSSTIGLDSFIVQRPWPLGVKYNAMTTLSISPNPASDVITISADDLMHGTVSILDIVGKEVMTAFIESNKLEIDISKLQLGNYIVKLSDTKTGKITTKRLVKQ
jgi:Secretion system C-terminal sorting domain